MGDSPPNPLASLPLKTRGKPKKPTLCQKLINALCSVFGASKAFNMAHLWRWPEGPYLASVNDTGPSGRIRS